MGEPTGADGHKLHVARQLWDYAPVGTQLALVSGVPFRNPNTDRPRPQPPSRVWRVTFGVVSVSAVVLAPIATLSLWLMITDPVTAAAVGERGDLLPVLVALAKVLGKALTAALAAL